MTTLDTASIRSGNEHQVAQYLRKLATEGDVENTTQQLIAAVERSSIAPSIFKIWLSISQSPAVLKAALQQDISVRIRKLATEQLQKSLQSSKWKDTWDGLGAVEGISTLFRDLPASDVQDSCRAIGSCTKGPDPEKREAITELFNALTTQTLDRRPLSQCYQYLVPGCTKGPVVQAVKTSMETWNNRQEYLLLRNHNDVLRENLLEMVLDYDGPHRPWLFPLLGKFPATPGTEPDKSSSMEFSLQVLRKLASDDQVSQISDEAFVYEIAQPLLKRCLKKKVARQILEEALHLVARYIDRYPSSAKLIVGSIDEYSWSSPSDSTPRSLIRKIGKGWLQMPDVFETLLRLLFVKTNSKPGQVDLKNIRSVLGKFERQHRYKLFKFYIQVCTVQKDEVEVDFDEGLARTTGCLGDGIFSYLDAEEGLDLFLRLRKARGDNIAQSNYFGGNSTIFELAKDRASDGYSRAKVDLDLWQVYLLQQASHQEEAENLAKLRIVERKKAQSTPDEELRAFHSRAVLFYAISSGSLSILSDVVTWAKRLVRDPSIKIFSGIPPKMSKVLSGLPISIGQDASILRERVKHGNQIMGDLFDLVCSGLREPNFNFDNWKEVLTLFHRVIWERANRLSELQQSFREEEIYSILWEETLKFILDLEEKALANELLQDSDGNYYRKVVLDFGGYNTTELPIKTRSPSTCRFLDNLAKERDQLWQKHRLSKSPNIVDFPTFPQGLPLQYLIKPFSFKPTSPLEDLAPYIASRAKAAIFPSPERSQALIPEDSDILFDPLGLFVEDYQLALTLFIPLGLSEQERRQRLNSAWAYAISSSSEGRMSEEEAIRYWRRPYKRFIDAALEQVTSELDDKKEIEEQEGILQKDLKWLEQLRCEPSPKPLYIPTVDNITSVLEWDAAPERKENIYEHCLEDLTYFDVSIDPKLQGLLHRCSNSEKEVLKYIVPPTVPERNYWHKTIWSRAGNNRAKSKFQLQEAQILSALLYLETKTLNKDHILPAPFPSADDVRYPASYLSSECLSRLDSMEPKPEISSGRRRRGRTHNPVPKASKSLDSNTKAALKALEAQISNVPPSLILQLAENAFSGLGSTDLEDKELTALESLAFNLLRLLARSDRPKLALDLAIRSISKYPGACFWHKPIFTLGFFRDLVPSDASEGIAKFAETVSDLLEKMERIKETKKAKVSSENLPAGGLEPSVEEKEFPAEESQAEIEADEKPPKDEPGFVKVSTIKLLIELFEDADFLPAASSFSSIHALCKISSHVDIHKTVIYYLLRVFRSSQLLPAEIFSILSTIADKNSESDIHKLILQLLNFALKSSKLDSQHQSLALPVISTIFTKTADIEIQKEILQYFTSSLDTPLGLDTVVQSLCLSMISKISQGSLDLPLRHALVAYLLRALNFSTPDVYDQILDTLKELITSCGNIDEREPVSETQWDQFEDTLELPDCDICGPITESRNPILLRLVKFYENIAENQSLNILFTGKIMIPIIQELKLQSSKYLSIFLRKYGVDKTTQQIFTIPPTSKSINLTGTIIQKGLGEGVVSLLQDFISYTIFNLDPPEVIKNLNNRFKEDSKLQELDEVENWLSSYGLDSEVLREIGLIPFIRETMGTPKEVDLGASVREYFLKLYKTMFWKEAKSPGFENFDKSDILIDQLEPEPLDAAWLNYIRPILQDTIQFIDSLRTKEWEQNPDREPQILPDTFRPQLWLLRIPSKERDGEDQETRCRVFAQEVCKVVDDISTSCEFISQVSTLKATLELTKNDAEDDVIVATYLGDLANVKCSPISIQDYTRIEVAATLLQRRNSTKSTILKERIDGMISSWKTCEAEAVRRLGYSMRPLKLELEPPVEEIQKKELKRKRRKVEMRSRQKMAGNRKRRWGPANFKPEKPNPPPRKFSTSGW